MVHLIKKVAYYLSIGVAGFIVLLFIVIIGVNIYITDSKATRILTSQIESSLNATASLQVTHFSLFHGFEIKNCNFLFRVTLHHYYSLIPLN
jgi:hypothetical protein